MDDTFKAFFSELVTEFETNRASILTPRFINAMRIGLSPEKGTERMSKGYYTSGVVAFNHNFLIQSLGNSIRNFHSTQKIIQWIMEIGGWPLEVKSTEDDKFRTPSITTNIVGGFLARIFELTGNFYRTPASFDQTLAELAGFFARDQFELTSYLSLHGPSGTLSNLELDTNVFIYRADEALAKLYNKHYSYDGGHYVDMFEGDYVLKATYQLPKTEFMKLTEFETPLLEKWFTAVLLAGVGNIERGKIIRYSPDWPLLMITAPQSFFYNPNLYNSSRPSLYQLNPDRIPHLQSITRVFKNIDLTKLDSKIVHAIARMTKAKATNSLDDRIVELALAFEYLINTEPYEVGLQLRIKGSKLYAIPGEEERIYRTLKEFYTLRSKVVHGNSTLVTDDRTLKTIYDAEEIIITILINLTELNLMYTFKQINEALNRSLYLPLPLKEILAKS